MTCKTRVTYGHYSGTMRMHNTENIQYQSYHSPVGNLILGATATHLVLCDWQDANGLPRPEIARRLQKYLGIHIINTSSASGSSTAILQEATIQLTEYFQGLRHQFTIPTQTFGTTFQQHVWQQLQTIPYGTTMTYRQQAEALSQPQAVRAVANANRLNAISIIIPCHRVIGSNHSLTGYAGGLDAKRWLINHEQQEIKI